MKAAGINIILFKLGWLACVVTAAKGVPLIGLIAVAAVVAAHLTTAHTVNQSVKLLGAAALIGLAWESTLASAGWLDYGANQTTRWLAPYWIVGMWILFATTLNLSFRWMKSRLWLAALFGAIGGPMAFVAGEKLGAVSFSDPVTTPVVIGLGWAVLMPLMVFLSRRFDGHHDLDNVATALLPVVPVQPGSVQQ